MVAITLGMPVDLEDQLFDDLVAHGHKVVARCDSGDELEMILEQSGCSVAIVSADSRYLTGSLLRTSDTAGFV